MNTTFGVVIAKAFVGEVCNYISVIHTHINIIISWVTNQLASGYIKPTYDM
jgi:hypothetical protein